MLSAIDLDEYYIKKIVSHEENGRNPKNCKFKVRWVGYEKMILGSIFSVKNLATLDSCSKEHPELQLG